MYTNTMYIEDLLLLLSNKATINPYDQKLVTSFCNQIFMGNGLTEKQANLAIKILSRQADKLELILNKSIRPFLDNPAFKLARRVANNQKSVSIIPHDEYGKAIKVEFPWNDKLLEQIRKERINLPYANWDKEKKAWIFALSERSIRLIKGICSNNDFVFDEEFLNYLNQFDEIQNNLEKYVPSITKTEEGFELCNIGQKIPPLKTDDVTEALFFARKMGIFTWDEKVSLEIQEKNIDPAIIKFLDSDPTVEFSINLEENSIFSIQGIIKNLLPCIFIIPGGSEIEKTTNSLELLKNIGIENSEISVLFRLPKETGEKFNQFVKDSNLNNQLTEKTKAIFISSKVPKPVIESSIRFNSLVNYSMYSAHYTVRELLKNHHNIIHILDKKPTKEIKFAFM